MTTGVADSLYAVQMNTCMSKQVRGDLPKRVKAAIASTEYKDVPEGDFADELKGAAIASLS